MKAKPFLQGIKQLDRKIENKQREVQALYDLIESVTITPKEVDVMTSGNDRRFENAISKIVDLKNEINHNIDAYVDRKLEAIRLINKLGNDEYINILLRRYVNYESWEQIANELGYTRQAINKKHGLALLEIEKLFT